MSATVTSEKREQQAAAFREACPLVAAFADECRAAFGPDTRLTWASEGGVEVGKKDTAVGLPLSLMVIDEVVLSKRVKSC